MVEVIILFLGIAAVMAGYLYVTIRNRPNDGRKNKR